MLQRKSHVSSAFLCPNCLRSGHSLQNCQCSFRCRLCKKQHNTLLHTDAGPATTSVNLVTQNISETSNCSKSRHKMMMTSLVLLTGPTGEQMTVRAMLDSGAETSILSSIVMRQLKIKPGDDWSTLSGIESPKNSIAKPLVQVTLSSLFNTEWSKVVSVVVVPKATIDLTRHDLPSLKELPHLQNLPLADPHFPEPRRVDLILDTDVMDEVLLPKKITGPPGSPSAWRTELGWGIMGRYTINNSVNVPTPVVHMLTAEPSEESQLNKTLEKFWVMEELPKGSNIFSPQETAVQEHFAETHYFSPPAGRYVVTLPKRDTTLQLGESQKTALNRFLRNEQALLRKRNWAAVVQEYLTLGHAQQVTPQVMCTPTARTYHLPMHAVYKQSSSSTKLRVVFDASCPTTTGLSLNDVLAAGPTNLDQILIRFRSYRVALSADIGKMYREVLLCNSDRQLHRFLWRPQTDQPVATYCMNRVTFGVRSSLYLAVRALQQTAADFSTPDSLNSWHIHNSFYVDDFLAGADDVSSAVQLYQELRELLLKAGFDLKKWRSSSSDVLQNIPSEIQELMPQQELVDHHSASYPKTLGIVWDFRKDVMAAQVQLPESYVSTKRGIVSDTARSFDVLGWLAPFILNMKVLFQQLWKKKIGWDEALNEELTARHTEWREQLPLLKTMTLPRCYFAAGTTTSTQLHGFSDASELAFAAVFYLRATYQDGSVSCRLVVAKMRVAPLHTVSMPRLELCGAEMLSELLAVTGNTLQIPNHEIYAWCDSWPGSEAAPATTRFLWLTE